MSKVRWIFSARTSASFCNPTIQLKELGQEEYLKMPTHQMLSSQFCLYTDMLEFLNTYLWWCLVCKIQPFFSKFARCKFKCQGSSPTPPHSPLLPQCLNTVGSFITCTRSLDSFGEDCEFKPLKMFWLEAGEEIEKGRNCEIVVVLVSLVCSLLPCSCLCPLYRVYGVLFFDSRGTASLFKAFIWRRI